MKKLMLALATCVAALVGTATTITVTTADDATSPVPEGSLRAAIAAAQDDDEIVFDASLKRQTINLSAQIVIDKSVKIVGPSERITLSGGWNGSGSGSGGSGNGIFYVNASEKTVELSNLNLVNSYGVDDKSNRALYVPAVGSVIVTDCSFSNNYCTRNGGAVRLDSNVVSAKFVRCLFADNLIDSNGNDGGGAIFSEQAASNFLFVDGCSFRRNCAIRKESSDGGGSIKSSTAATVVIANSEFSDGMTSESSGGAIKKHSGGSLYVVNSTFRGNYIYGDSWGPAIDARGPTYFANCTFAGNMVGDSKGTSGSIYLGGSKGVVNTAFAYNWRNAIGSPYTEDTNNSGGLNAGQMRGVVVNGKKQLTTSGTQTDLTLATTLAGISAATKLFAAYEPISSIVYPEASGIATVELNEKVFIPSLLEDGSLARVVAIDPEGELVSGGSLVKVSSDYLNCAFSEDGGTTWTALYGDATLATELITVDQRGLPYPIVDGVMQVPIGAACVKPKTINEQAAELEPGAWIAAPLTGNPEDIVNLGEPFTYTYGNETFTMANTPARASMTEAGHASVNGVTFPGWDVRNLDVSGGWNGGDASYFGKAGMDGTDYGCIMDGGWSREASGDATFHIGATQGCSKLVPGELYLVQVIVHNGRNDTECAKTVSEVTTGKTLTFGSMDPASEWYYGGTFVHLFQAPSNGEYSFTLNYPADYAQYNAIQVRHVLRPVEPSIGSVTANVIDFSTEVVLSDVEKGTDETGAITAASYDVYAYETSNPSEIEKVVPAASGDTTSFTFDNLVPGRSYNYRIFIVNDANVTSVTRKISFVCGWKAGAMSALGDTIETRGKLLYAYTHGTSGTLTVNTVPFERCEYDLTGAKFSISPGFTGRWNNDLGAEGASGDYGAMLAGAWNFNENTESTRTITLTGLTEGNTYLVQIVAHSGSANQQDMTVSVEGTAPQCLCSCNGAEYKYGASIVGVFTADGTSKNLTITYAGGKMRPFNAIQVRDITPRTIAEQAAELAPGAWIAAPLTGDPSDVLTLGEPVTYTVGNETYTNAYAKGAASSGMTEAGHASVNGIVFNDGFYKNLTTSSSDTAWANEHGNCGLTGDYAKLLDSLWWIQNVDTVTYTIGGNSYPALEVGEDYVIQLFFHSAFSNQSGSWTTHTVTADTDKTVKFGAANAGDDWYYGGTLVHRFTAESTSYSFTLNYSGPAIYNAFQIRKVAAAPAPAVPVYTLTIPPKTGIESVLVTTNGTEVTGVNNAYSIVSNTEVTVTFTAASGYEITGINPVTLTIEADKTFGDSDYPAVEEQDDRVLVWSTGTYTPSAWTPADANLLRGITAALSDGFEKYVEGSTSQNPATLTDGEVPPGEGKTNCDYTKIFPIKKGALTWTLEEPSDIRSFSVYSRWGDKGRSAICLSELAVRYAMDGEWEVLGTDLSNTTELDALYGILSESNGGFIAEKVVQIRVTFNSGSQEADGVGYVEFEAQEVGKPVIGSAEVSISGTTATISLSDVDLFGAASYDVYCAYGSHGATLPAPTRVVTGATATSTSFDLTGLTLGGVYDYEVYVISSSDKQSDTFASAFHINDPASAVQVSGAKEIIDGDDIVYVWTDTTQAGTLTLANDVTADYLLVGGGGAGGFCRGGGGGGGGVVQGADAALTYGTYTITVGAGGTPDAFTGGTSCHGYGRTTEGANGQSSVLSSEAEVVGEAFGGGGGGTFDSGNNVTVNSGLGYEAGVRNVATGGGSTGKSTVSAAGYDGMGFAGGAAFADNDDRASGGGGGAGAVGETPTAKNRSGNGGAGVTSTITGASVCYGGGGGGGVYADNNNPYSVPGEGGAGGGGHGGSTENANLTAGVDGLGGGGGGASGFNNLSDNCGGAPGGSGTVIVRLPLSALTEPIVPKVVVPSVGSVGATVGATAVAVGVTNVVMGTDATGEIKAEGYDVVVVCGATGGDTSVTNTFANQSAKTCEVAIRKPKASEESDVEYTVNVFVVNDQNVTSATQTCTFTIDRRQGLPEVMTVEPLIRPGLIQAKFGEKVLFEEQVQPPLVSNLLTQTEYVSSLDFTYGALMANQKCGDASVKIANPYTGNLWNWDTSYSVFAYEGEIYLEQGQQLVMYGRFDDGSAAVVDGVTLFAQGTTSGYNGEPAVKGIVYTAQATGWYPLNGWVWDWTGGKNVVTISAIAYNLQGTTGSTTDTTIWKHLEDTDGKGSFLRSKDPKTTLMTLDVPQTDDLDVTIGAAFGDLPCEAKFVAYASNMADGGLEPSGWENRFEIATIPAGGAEKTTYTVKNLGLYPYVRFAIEASASGSKNVACKVFRQMSCAVGFGSDGLAILVGSPTFTYDSGSFDIVVAGLGEYGSVDLEVEVATDDQFTDVITNATFTGITVPGSFPIELTDLTPSTTYYVRVKPTADGEPLDWIVTDPVVTASYPPVVFSKVELEKSGADFVSLYFTVSDYGDQSSCADFFIDVSTSADFESASTVSTQVSDDCDDEVPFMRRAAAYGLTSDTQYYARVRAVNEKNTTSTTDVIDFTTPHETDVSTLIWANVGSDFSKAENFVEHIAPTAASDVYFNEPMKVQPYLDKDVTVNSLRFASLTGTGWTAQDGYDGTNYSGYVMTGAEGATLTVARAVEGLTMTSDNGVSLAGAAIASLSSGTNKINVPVKFAGAINSTHIVWVDRGMIELNGDLVGIGDDEQLRFWGVDNNNGLLPKLVLGGDNSRFMGRIIYGGNHPTLTITHPKAMAGFTTLYSSAWGGTRVFENTSGGKLVVPSLATFYMGANDGFAINGDPIEFPNATLECHGDNNHDKGITYNTLVTVGKIVLCDGNRVVVNGSETGGLVNLGALEAGPAGTPVKRWIYVNEAIYVACVPEGLDDARVVRSSSWGSRKPMLGLGFDWAATIGGDADQDTNAFAGENNSQDYFFGLAAWENDQTVTLFGDPTAPLYCTKASDSNASYHAPGQLSFGNVNAKGTLTLANPVDLNGGGRTFYAYDGAAYVDGRIAGGIVSSADASKNIAKRGFGVIAVDGDMTFTGDSTIYEGGLLVNGTCANNFTVGNNSQPAMLGGTGTVRNVSVGPNATLRPGEMGGTLTVSGKIKLYSNAILEIDVGAETAGCVKFTGTTEFNDPFIVKVNAIDGNKSLNGRVKIMDWSELGSAPDFKKEITVQADEACFSGATLEKGEDGYYLNYQGKLSGFMMIISATGSTPEVGSPTVAVNASGAGYTWFDAGLGGYAEWPVAGGSLVVDSIGSWANTGSGELVGEGGAKEILVAGATTSPLAFTVDSARNVANGVVSFISSAKFVMLTPVSALDADTGAIGAISAATANETAAYYGLVDGAWTALTGATPSEGVITTFKVDVKVDSNVTYVRYSVGDTVLTVDGEEWLVSAATAGSLNCVAFAGYGTLTSVGGSTDFAPATVAMTVPAIDNVSVDKVTVNGLEIEGENGVYDVPSGENVVIVFKGDDGYSLSTDTMRFPAETVDFTIPETGRPVATFTGGILRINEIMASNGATIKTKNGGEGLDWVEIYNAGDNPIDITGWYLSDNPDKAQSKWKQIEGHAYIPAKGYKIIWCDKDYANFDGIVEAWSPIGLSTSGETVFLADPYGNICDTVVMGTQVKDISYGVGKMPGATEQSFVYFNEPTPGTENGEIGYGPMTPAVAFSVPHGYKTAPIYVAITCEEDPTAEIWYTLDGTRPAADNPKAVKYTAPIHITSTTILRAGVPQPNSVLQVDSSATYIYLDDVLTMDRVEKGSGVPAGFPDSGFNGHNMRYGMIQSIVNGPDRERMLRGFTNTIATISIVVDPQDLFAAADGIYVNPRKYMNDGEDGERPMLLEQIDPVHGAANEFSVPGGLRLRGAGSRDVTNPKHAFRFFFRGKYGMAKLNFPLFGDEGADEFSKVDLRCSQNYSWSYNDSDYETFVHEVFSRDSQRDLGQIYTRSRYYNLFVNGQYWGLYQTQERGDEEFAETYLGGNEDYYDCIKTWTEDQYHYKTTAKNGNDLAWYQLQGLAYYGFDGANVDNYNRVLGLNPDGTRNSEYPILLNPENLMAYVTIAHFVCDADGPVSVNMDSGKGGLNNLYANRYEFDGKSDLDGFWFLRHDAEHSMGVVGSGSEPFTTWTQYDHDPTALGTYEGRALSSDPADNERWRGTDPAGDKRDFMHFGPYQLHWMLAKNPVYKRAFADYFYKNYLKEGGAMTAPVAKARFESRMAEIDDVIVAEAARWSRDVNNPKSRETWLAACQHCLDFIDNRIAYMKPQYQARGWYPMINVPEPDVEEAAVGETVTFSVLKDDGETEEEGYEVVYTTDGSDPADSATAVTAKTLTLTTLPCAVKARARKNGEYSALQEVEYKSAAPESDGYTFIFEGEYAGDQIIAPTGTECVVVFDGATINGSLVLPDGVKAYLCPTNGTENTVQKIIGEGAHLTLKDFDGLGGKVSLEGEDTLISVSNLVVKSGVLDLTSTGVTETKKPIVNVLGHVKQDGGEINIDLSAVSADPAKQAYGIYVANKDPEDADGKNMEIIYAEFNGGEFNAKVGGWKSAALYINKGSVEATFNEGSTNHVELVGPEARFVNAAGDLNLKGGEFDVTMPVDCTSITNARVFKSDKEIKIKGGHYDVNVPGPGAEIFSAVKDKKDSIITVKDGTFELVADDDCFSADDRIDIQGGLFYAVSLNNDVFDSNGDMLVSGGTIMAYATAAGHEAFDVDPVVQGSEVSTFLPHQLTISGGTIFATGGKNAAWPTIVNVGDGVNLYQATEIEKATISEKYASIKGAQTIEDSEDPYIVTTTAKLPVFLGSNGALLMTCPNMAAGATPTYSGTAPTKGDQQFHNLYISSNLPSNQEFVRIYEVYGSTNDGNKGDTGEYFILTNVSDKVVQLAGLTVTFAKHKDGVTDSPKLNITLTEGTIPAGGTVRFDQSDFTDKGWDKITNGMIYFQIINDENVVIQSGFGAFDNELFPKTDRGGAALRAKRFDNETPLAATQADWKSTAKPTGFLLIVR